jgi:hypothetical protein
VPLLIVERLYRTYKQDCKVIIGNSERLQANPFFTKTILPTLELYKNHCLVFSGRNTITSIMNDYPSCIAVAHQWNNQYNYMTLEYLTAGFPVIHNAPDWSDVGYYYPGHDLSEGEAALLRSQVQHSGGLERYKSGAEVLRWRHSPYNPDMQKAWFELLN